MRVEENKYTQIYQDLSRKIKSKKLAPKSLLPSEHILSREYDVSRGTIRKALNLLTENGLIHKKRGKGSIILEADQFELPVSGLVSFNEVSLASENQWETSTTNWIASILATCRFFSKCLLPGGKVKKSGR